MLLTVVFAFLAAEDDDGLPEEGDLQSAGHSAGSGQ